MATPAVVYNSQTFCEELAHVICSSRNNKAVRVCLCMTRDRIHAISVLKDTVVSCNQPLYHFTVAGRRQYNPKNMMWESVGEGTEAAGLLRYAQELKGGGIVILEDCVPFLRDEGGDIRARRILADMLSIENINEGLVLVFLDSPEGEHRLPSILADQFIRLEISYPRAKELEAIAREEIAVALHRVKSPLSVDKLQTEARRLSSGVVGLTRSAARDALRDSLAPNPLEFDNAFDRLQQRKAMTLNRELAMNVLDTSEIEEPIGLAYLVDYLKITREKMSNTGHSRAKGILLIGPPGTGKTMIARAIGKIVNLPVVEFRISSLMNSLLGETERRFAQAFATLEAMSPNVVFIDEIEKAFGDSSERDGGTMMRCTGALLSWLSDNPYPNYICATSNSLRRMGEIGLTMTRSERFDASFFVDVPSYHSRLAMLQRWLPQSLRDQANIADELANLTEKFTGADIRSIIKQAIAKAEYEQEELKIRHLKEQIERKRMRAIALYDEFQELRRWGQLYCDPAGPTS